MYILNDRIALITNKDINKYKSNQMHPSYHYKTHTHTHKIIIKKKPKNNSTTLCSSQIFKTRRKNRFYTLAQWRGGKIKGMWERRTSTRKKEERRKGELKQKSCWAIHKERAKSNKTVCSTCCESNISSREAVFTLHTEKDSESGSAMCLNPIIICPDSAPAYSRI